MLKYLRKCANSLLAQLENFYMLHYKIQITVLIPANTKRRSNVVLILGQRRRQGYNIQPTEGQVNVFTGPSECVSISRANIYVYKSTKGQWGLLMSEVGILKSIF